MGNSETQNGEIFFGWPFFVSLICRFFKKVSSLESLFQNWSTESMRNSAEAWSLADDVCLRVFLESFGAKLDENLRQVLDSLGKLEDRIEASSINLGQKIGLKFYCHTHKNLRKFSGNVTNRLGLLSSTQFVESRVAEDDDTSHLIKDETKESSEDPNSDKLFCEKVGKALSFGNAFIESAFVTVDVSMKPICFLFDGRLPLSFLV